MSELFNLNGRVACVTGATSGIGAAMAAALVDKGVKVIGLARNIETGPAGVHMIKADLSDLEMIDELARQIAEPYGAPDILINAAGVNPRQHADEAVLSTWKMSIDLNLSAPFFLAQALVPAMKEKGWGRIINIASLQTTRAFTNGIAYGAAKGGIGQLTRAMAEAWSPSGINTNAIAPGFFPTALTAAVFNDSEVSAHHAKMTCIGRNGKLDDLIGPLLFLSSDASNYVTGQVLAVDGGYTAK